MLRFFPFLLIALTADFGQAAEGQVALSFHAVECEGSYPHHLQGVCTDDKEAIFWSFTTILVKTDRKGKVVKRIPVENHHGDLCHHDGKIHVAVNLGEFNDPKGKADSWVYVYDARDLSILAKHKTPEVFHGAGGIAQHDGKFLVVGGLPAGVKENFAYEYDGNFRFLKKHGLPSGQTLMGIQTAAFAEGHWWFGCYGDPKILLKADKSLQKVERFEFDCSLGMMPVGEGQFLIGRGVCSKEKGCTGRLIFAKADKKRGLVQEESPPVSFQQGDGMLQIAIGGQSIAEYIFNDNKIRRPYFRHLQTLCGVQVTRNHPPVKGQDLDDHETMHPGLWLAFGNLNGADFWRNKGRVRHVGFIKQPEGQLGHGSFMVQNAYEANGRILCVEDCQITVSVRSAGYLLDWSSSFCSEQGDFTFGDQEEMGLAVRVATPLTVVKGGAITDSEDRKNESQVWGKQADWCEYGGMLGGQKVGVVLIPHPRNFRRSWFHARDYGLLVANPFGQNAFTKGEKSRITVKKGEGFKLRFGVLIYASPEGPSQIVRSYLKGEP